MSDLKLQTEQVKKFKENTLADQAKKEERSKEKMQKLTSHIKKRDQQQRELLGENDALTQKLRGLSEKVEIIDNSYTQEFEDIKRKAKE